MKNFIFVSVLFCACTSTAPKVDTWATFTQCATNNCVREAIAVKDAFMKDPKHLLTDFQATYEKGEDHVIGWLFILRDSVLLNPQMGTIQQRLTLQQSIIAAAKPFEKDAKVHEMAKSVMDELGIADIANGKVNDPMANALPETATFCYQYTHNGDTTSCQLTVAENGDFSGYYAVLISEKDGRVGILKGKTPFGKDTLIADFKYSQEGEVATEPLMFVKKGDKLVNLVSEVFDKKGNMVLTDKKKLRAGDALGTVNCTKLKGIIQYIQEEKLTF